MRAAEGEAGFLLIDMAMAVSVLLIIALLAWPALISQTTAPKIAATAFDIASTLRMARATAGREGRPTSVTFDLNRRRISADAGRSVSMAQDLTVDFRTDRRCRASSGVYILTFQPDGRSCGGVFTAERGEAAWRVEVNWMTGAVNVVRGRRA